jgi:hypothetical protein
MKTLIAAVLIGGVFGSASATVEESDAEVMVVTIEVEVMTSAESVVAHLDFDGEPVATLPLIDRGEGVYGIRAELEPKNYMVVFEVVGDEAGQSDPVSLTQLGADLGPEASPTTSSPEDEGMAPETQRLMWLAVALGAASLSALAFWVLGGREGTEESPPADEEE